MNGDKQITPLGATNYRNDNTVFGIRDADRLMHMYLLGKSGSGKSTFILNMAISDISRGHGCALLDPHGELSKEILNYIPAHRIKDVVYFNPKDTDNPIPFNPLSGVPEKHHNLVASGIISTMKKVWADSWGPRMEHILRFSLLSLLQYPGATLLDIQPLLTNEEFRNRVLQYVKDTLLRNFWMNEFAAYTRALRAEAIAPILNKVGIFSASLPLRYSLGQKKRGLRMLDIMDSRKILIVNLSKGELGEDTSALLGSMIITAIQLAALYRARIPSEKRIPFFLYIDEMHSYVTMSFCDILAEARKYGLGLFLTHQYLEQIDSRILAAILGNVGTLISFRIGANDAQTLEREFYPTFSAEDLVHLPRYHMYLKLMIDGTTSRPFSAVSLPIQQDRTNTLERVVRLSRTMYAGSKKDVDGNYTTIPSPIPGQLF